MLLIELLGATTHTACTSFSSQANFDARREQVV